MLHEQEPDPMHDIEGQLLILDLPPIADETALQLSSLLQTLTERFEETYASQILRAHRAREKERERLFHERCFHEDQRRLPFEEDIRF